MHYDAVTTCRFPALMVVKSPTLTARRETRHRLSQYSKYAACANLMQSAAAGEAKKRSEKRPTGSVETLAQISEENWVPYLTVLTPVTKFQKY